ncbi:hypothetical protein L209DRAFT_245249 [Thermothelomyces heterothallicus CBS 203.75]
MALLDPPSPDYLLPGSEQYTDSVEQDAAYLVEAAAVARTLPRLVGCNGDARTLVRSGAVLVHGDEYKRWKDGRKWSDGRNLKNGFNIYRELATDPADCMTREELVGFFFLPLLSLSLSFSLKGLYLQSVAPDLCWLHDGHCSLGLPVGTPTRI